MMTNGADMGDFSCPFCGNRDIEYGLALCLKCEADIFYHVEEEEMSPEFAARADALAERAEKASRDMDNSPSLLAMFHGWRAQKHAKEALSIAEEGAYEAQRRHERQRQKGGYETTVRFARQGRVIDVKYTVPENPDFVDKKFDILINSFGKNRLRVTKGLCDNLKFGIVEAKNFLDSVPKVVMTTEDRESAEKFVQLLKTWGAEAAICERVN